MILDLVRSTHLEILLAGQGSWAGSVTFRGENRRPGPEQVGLVRCSGPFGRGEGMSGRRPGVTAAGPVTGRVMMARPDSAAWRDVEFLPAGVRGGGGGLSTAAGSNQFQGLWLLPLSLATGPGSNFEPVTRIGVTQPPGEYVYSRRGSSWRRSRPPGAYPGRNTVVEEKRSTAARTRRANTRPPGRLGLRLGQCGRWGPKCLVARAAAGISDGWIGTPGPAP